MFSSRNTIFAIFSATICCVICINIVRIVYVLLTSIQSTSNNIFRIWSWLLPSGSNTWTSILLIVISWITISWLTSSWTYETRSTRNILIVLNKRALCHIVIIIETLANILNLSWLQGSTLILWIRLRTGLLLWCSVEVAWCHRELFHVHLWIGVIWIWHLMILALSQLLLALESNAWFLHWKLWVIASRHLLIAIISIDLLLTWRALSIEWIYLRWLYSSLIFGINIRQLWLHILLVAPMAIVAIGMLQRPLFTLYKHLLIILILIELLLIVHIISTEQLISNVPIILDCWLFLVCISVVIIKATSSCSCCISHNSLQIDFDGVVFLIIWSLYLLSC